MMAKKANIHTIHRLIFFVIPLLLLFLLMLYSQNFGAEFYPPLDKRLENNATITLDIDTVEEIISDTQYVVNGVIVSFPDKIRLNEGERISVEGVYKAGTLQVEKYHIHKYYRLKYFLSFLALPVLFYYMRKEWKFDFRTFCFKGKGR